MSGLKMEDINKRRKGQTKRWKQGGWSEGYKWKEEGELRMEGLDMRDIDGNEGQRQNQS